ncbi:MAG TPA: cysteine desulfurase-like protein, partial [Woeseiaceae bacterium]|nr:cysteine desulfurase-like protein [Woeseiaceae bacterium]
MPYDLDVVRARFPALSLTDGGRRRYYFDNPAGTQVPDLVVDAMSDCLFRANANIGGSFETSRRADAVVANARAAVADLLNAPSPAEIIFGQNMTSLTLHLSRSIGRALCAGDEIVLSRMDHDANVQPWLLMARDHDLEVRWLSFDPERFEFDLDHLDALLSGRTRLVCIGSASNLTGTLNDVAAISRRARAAGAWTFVDAVQAVPHVTTDVQALGCDFLVCSGYKFFGPHQGALWGRAELLQSLEPYKVRPAPEELPWCFEPGTQSHEGIAGMGAAVEYLAWLGRTLGNPAADGARRAAVESAMAAIFRHEQALSARLVAGLQALPGIRVKGITDKDALGRRVPTVSFIHPRVRPADLAAGLGRRNFFVWSGHNYAVEAARTLGLLNRGGVLRVGPVHY